MDKNEILDKLLYKTDKKTGEKRIGKKRLFLGSLLGLFLLLIMIIIISGSISSMSKNPDDDYYTLGDWHTSVSLDVDKIENIYRVADADPLSKDDYFVRIIMEDGTQYYLEDDERVKVGDYIRSNEPIYLSYWDITTKDGATNKKLVSWVTNYPIDTK